MANSQITKRAVAVALKQCMEHTPFEKITITDICDGCGLNRKSFYYHFQNKYELVIWIFEEEIGRPIREKAENKRISLPLAIELCDALASERAFYANALRTTGPGSFREYLAHQMQPMGHAPFPWSMSHPLTGMKQHIWSVGSSSLRCTGGWSVPHRRAQPPFLKASHRHRWH